MFCIKYKSFFKYKTKCILYLKIILYFIIIITIIKYIKLKKGEEFMKNKFNISKEELEDYKNNF